MINHTIRFTKKKKKIDVLPIKLAAKKPFFFFSVIVAIQLKSSRSWNFHILLEAVYMNKAFSGEQFSTMDLNS